MWGLDSLGLPITSADGNVTLPLWAAAVAAALLLVFFILALMRTGLAGTLVFIALVGFGIWGAWAWTDRERIDQRRSLEHRLAVLDAQALAPASPLACLDASGDVMETSCERTIFASPEATAAAMSFTATRLLLLQDWLRFAASRDPSFESTAENLRKSLEGDRYGVVAQVLAARHGCSPERCDALRLLRDPARVRANMRDRTFETNASRYAAAWSTRATTSTTGPNGTGTIPGTVAAPVPPRYTLPSAASIPPVSIMSNEPAASTPPAAAPATQSPATAATPSATAPAPAPAPRRPAPPRPQTATPPASPPPMPLSPAGPPLRP